MVAACGLETAGVKCGYLQSKLKKSHNRKKKCQEQTDSVKPAAFCRTCHLFSGYTLHWEPEFIENKQMLLLFLLLAPQPIASMLL